MDKQKFIDSKGLRKIFSLIRRDFAKKSEVNDDRNIIEGKIAELEGRLAALESSNKITNN